jgi:hypothetical protein
MAQKSSMYDLAWSVEGDSVEVEQGAGFGDVASVTIHKSQLRLLAAEMGLMHGDLNAWQRVATLERRLCVLRDRIATLDGYLHEDLARDQADLPHLCTFSDGTFTLADEWCADLGLDDLKDDKTQGKPKANPAETDGVSAPGKCDAVGQQAGLPLERQ